MESQEDHAPGVEHVPQGRAYIRGSPAPRMADGQEPINAESAKAAAGITEEVRTWSGWRELGYEVMHGSKALFGCVLIWGSKGDGAVYNARFFGASQVQAIA